MGRVHSLRESSLVVEGGGACGVQRHTKKLLVGMVGLVARCPVSPKRSKNTHEGPARERKEKSEQDSTSLRRIPPPFT